MRPQVRWGGLLQPRNPAATLMQLSIALEAERRPAVPSRPAQAAAAGRRAGAASSPSPTHPSSPLPPAAAMDKLKALVAAKRKAAEEEFGGKKYVRRGEIEELRLAKLREEEAREREAKVSGRCSVSVGASMNGLF